MNAYNHDRYGIIAYDNVHHVLIANSQTYNNHTYDRFLGGGINIAGDSFDNTILNCKSYSNRFGIYLADSNTNGNKIIGAQLYQNEQ